MYLKKMYKHKFIHYTSVCDLLTIIMKYLNIFELKLKFCYLASMKDDISIIIVEWK